MITNENVYRVVKVGRAIRDSDIAMVAVSTDGWRAIAVVVSLLLCGIEL